MPQNEPPAELVEIAARALCAASSTEWRTNAGMSKAAIEMLDHDALNNHWRGKARAVLAAVTPQIEARVTGEIVAWLRKDDFISTADALAAGEYKESQP